MSTRRPAPTCARFWARSIARAWRYRPPSTTGSHQSCWRTTSTSWSRSRSPRPPNKGAPWSSWLPAHGRILQVGHLERFNPAIRSLVGVISRPRFIECHRLAPFVERGTEVDVMLDLMIHDLDIILSVVDGDVVERVEAVGVPVLSENVDIANARLRFVGGTIANVTASRVALKRERKIRFFQSDAYVSVDYGERSIRICAADRATLPADCPRSTWRSKSSTTPIRSSTRSRPSSDRYAAARSLWSTVRPRFVSSRSPSVSPTSWRPNERPTAHHADRRRGVRRHARCGVRARAATAACRISRWSGVGGEQAPRRRDADRGRQRGRRDDGIRRDLRNDRPTHSPVPAAGCDDGGEPPGPAGPGRLSGVQPVVGAARQEARDPRVLLHRASGVGLAARPDPQDPRARRQDGGRVSLRSRALQPGRRALCASLSGIPCSMWCAPPATAMLRRSEYGLGGSEPGAGSVAGESSQGSVADRPGDAGSGGRAALGRMARDSRGGAGARRRGGGALDREVPRSDRRARRYLQRPRVAPTRRWWPPGPRPSRRRCSDVRW